MCAPPHPPNPPVQSGSHSSQLPLALQGRVSFYLSSPDFNQVQAHYTVRRFVAGTTHNLPRRVRQQRQQRQQISFFLSGSPSRVRRKRNNNQRRRRRCGARLKHLQRSLSHRRRRPARGFPHRCGGAGRGLLLTCVCGRGLEEGGRGVTG